MTWKVKWPTNDGTTEIVCDEPSKVAELFDEAKEKGFDAWIEDHKGKRLERRDF